MPLHLFGMRTLTQTSKQHCSDARAHTYMRDNDAIHCISVDICLRFDAVPCSPHVSKASTGETENVVDLSVGEIYGQILRCNMNVSVEA